MLCFVALGCLCILSTGIYNKSCRLNKEGETERQFSRNGSYKVSSVSTH